MQYPYLEEVTRYREMTNAFGGYNHQLSCQEGQFYDMKNMTSQYYPILSPRNERGIARQFANPQGILDKEELMWVDDGILYKNGEKAWNGNPLSTTGKKTLVKMGAYVVIFPDKMWYNTENGWTGKLEHRTGVSDGHEVSFTLCDSKGSQINAKDVSYYEKNAPNDGDYMLTKANGKSSLKVYASTTKSWVTVTTTYVCMSSVSIGDGFEKGDGIKITIDNSKAQWKGASSIFVNDEGDGKYSINTCVVDRTEGSITFIGLLDEVCSFTNMDVTVERTVPDMEFVTECNNRLWGCSKDGHEIYCSKLGDVKNWNCFQGISTDSWTATIGSDGKFTGATTYLGYPIFFKEDSLIKISVSGTGGHQTKETKCRGVQKGSERSLSILNETLYYKSPSGVCAYTGSLPVGISDELGDVRYKDAVAGTIGDRYYISMKDNQEESNLFVYDTKNGIWCREDSTDAMFFCSHEEDLYYIDTKDMKMKSIRGTMPYELKESEGKFLWFVESGNIGYSSPDNKYISRINLRMSLDFGTNVDFYLQYDSNGKWEHKFNMSGKGTKTFTVPIIPKRCDHFKYKIVGKGGCKIHSITKTLEQGSDI